MRKILLLGGILVVVGVLLLGAAFVMSGFDLSGLDTAAYETKTYAVSEAVTTLEIQTDEADIALRPSDDGTLRVDCVARQKVDYTVLAEQGTLRVTAVDRRAWYDHLSLFSVRSQSVTVYLPNDSYEALTVRTDTGDVSVPDDFSFGTAEIAAGTGEIDFEASVERGLCIRTSTGDIRLVGVRAGQIELSATTGDIVANNVDCTGTLSVILSTGELSLTDVSCAALVSSGSTGEAKLKNVIALERFEIERDTGDVRFERCDAGQITVKTSTGDVSGTLRTEKVFITKSSTGDIRVPDTVSGGRCEITTSTGDIRIELEREP